MLSSDFKFIVANLYIDQIYKKKLFLRLDLTGTDYFLKEGSNKSFQLEPGSKQKAFQKPSTSESRNDFILFPLDIFFNVEKPNCSTQQIMILKIGSSYLT